MVIWGRESVLCHLGVLCWDFSPDEVVWGLVFSVFGERGNFRSLEASCSWQDEINRRRGYPNFLRSFQVRRPAPHQAQGRPGVCRVLRWSRGFGARRSILR